MNVKFNNFIKEKAYELWINKNKPENKDLDIWLEAENIIYNEPEINHKGNFF